MLRREREGPPLGRWVLTQENRGLKEEEEEEEELSTCHGLTEAAACQL